MDRKEVLPRESLFKRSRKNEDLCTVKATRLISYTEKVCNIQIQFGKVWSITF